MFCKLSASVVSLICLKANAQLHNRESITRAEHVRTQVITPAIREGEDIVGGRQREYNVSNFAMMAPRR